MTTPLRDSRAISRSRNNPGGRQRSSIFAIQLDDTYQLFSSHTSRTGVADDSVAPKAGTKDSRLTVLDSAQRGGSCIDRGECSLTSSRGARGAILRLDEEEEENPGDVARRRIRANSVKIIRDSRISGKSDDDDVGDEEASAFADFELILGWILARSRMLAK